MNRNQTNKMKTQVDMKHIQKVSFGQVIDSTVCHRCKYQGHDHHFCHLARCKVCRMFGHDEQVCPHKS